MNLMELFAPHGPSMTGDSAPIKKKTGHALLLVTHTNAHLGMSRAKGCIDAELNVALDQRRVLNYTMTA